MAGPAPSASADARTYERYTGVAIALHWVIALAIIGQIAFGKYFANALQSDDAAAQARAFDQIQIHKAIGLTILALTVMRIVWRLGHPVPPLPAGMAWYERAGSAVSHYGFYFLMLALPLSGWAMSSVSVQFGALPTVWFGLFTVPHLPIPVTGEAQAALDDTLHSTHEWLGYMAIALLLLHVGAALKHHLIDRDAVLARMTPFVSPKDGGTAIPARKAISGGRATLAALLAAGIGFGGGWLARHNAPGAVTAAELGSAGPLVADAPIWSVDKGQSAIRFSGIQSGQPFSGVFETWAAEIAFAPDMLDASKARVEIDMTSATTGDMMFDGTLPDPDWFDTAQYQIGLFEADSFTEAGNGYEAAGTLTLKGVANPVTLPFTLTIEDGTADVAGTLTIDRFDWGIGGSTGADSVAAEVDLMIELIATRE